MQVGRYAGIAKLTRYNSPDVHAGMGVVMDCRHVITCAHVVNEALHRSPESVERPERDKDKVDVSFPFSNFKSAITGGVQTWYPTGSRVLSDVAVLELDKDIPADVGVPLINHRGEVDAGEFFVYGATLKNPGGGHVEGRVKGKLPDGTLEIVGTSFVDLFIEPGYSGAAVWDPRIKRVVGIVSQKLRDSSVRIAYIIPASVFKDLWPVEQHEKELDPATSIMTRRTMVILILGTIAAGGTLFTMRRSNTAPTLYLSNAVAYAPLQLARLNGKLPSWRIEDDQHLSRKERRRKLASQGVEFFAGPLGEFVIDIAQQLLFETPPILLWVIAESQGSDAIVARSSEFTLNDLVREGVVVAGWTGGTAHYLTLYRLAQAKLDATQMNFVSVDNPQDLVNGLASKAYDVIATWSPWSEVAVRNGGHIITRGGGKYGPPDKYSGILATNKDHIRNHDRALQELFGAWDGAVQYLRMHPEETSKTLAPWLELSKEQALESLGHVHHLTVKESLDSGPYGHFLEIVHKQAQFAGLSRTGMSTNLEIDSSAVGRYANSISTQNK